MFKNTISFHFILINEYFLDERVKKKMNSRIILSSNDLKEWIQLS